MLKEKVFELLLKTGSSIAFAESCTGGLLSAHFTEMPGVSDVFWGSIVAYHNDVKVNILNVNKDHLQEWGAVSEAVALEMAQGARKSCGAEIGVGVTGIAGPAGGSDDKPVGLVFISVSHSEGNTCRKFVFSGDRKDVQEKAVAASFQMLVDELSTLAG